MYRTRQQSSTAYPILVKMVSSTDGTPATGKTVSCELSKNGGAFAEAAGEVSEVGTGIYALAGNSADRNTKGPCVACFTASGCNAEHVEFEIVAYDVFSGVETASLAANSMTASALASDAVAKIAAALSGKSITFNGPVLEDRSIVLDVGDDYTHASRNLEWTITGWDGPDADGVNGELRFLALDTYKEFGDQSAATMVCGLVITQSGNTLTVKAMPTSAQTSLLGPATHEGGKALYQAKALIPATAWVEEMEWSLFRVSATAHRKI